MKKYFKLIAASAALFFVANILLFLFMQKELDGRMLTATGTI